MASINLILPILIFHTGKARFGKIKFNQRFSTLRYFRTHESKLSPFAYLQIKDGPIYLPPNQIL
jgi:hypothetical protein